MEPPLSPGHWHTSGSPDPDELPLGMHNTIFAGLSQYISQLF